MAEVCIPEESLIVEHDAVAPGDDLGPLRRRNSKRRLIDFGRVGIDDHGPIGDGVAAIVKSVLADMRVVLELQQER